MNDYLALSSIVNGMPNYIEKRNGVWWVQNPVDPTENFAERWQDRPEREQDFRYWHKKLEYDLQRLSECDDIDGITELLIPMFGERVALPAVKSYKDSLLIARARTISVTSSSSRSEPNKPWGF